MSEDLNKLDGYLIMKRGLYYRPNSCGYTGIRDSAGRYTLAEALKHADPISGVTFVHESEAKEFSSACYDDLARDHLRAQVADLRQRLQAAEERAEKVEGETSFLLERLEEFAAEITTETLSREWYGHVSPALARVRAALKTGA